MEVSLAEESVDSVETSHLLKGCGIEIKIYKNSNEQQTLKYRNIFLIKLRKNKQLTTI